MRYVVGKSYACGEILWSWFEALGEFRLGQRIYLNVEGKADPESKQRDSNFVGVAVRMDDKLPKPTEP